MLNSEQLRKLDKILETVEKPARYTGGEMNASQKPFGSTELSFAFCFPDTYEIAMSHLGMKILYHIINLQPWALCERVMMPWADMADAMRRENVPLFSLETRTPLCDFDVAGFTLQYEMSFTNIPEMLSLGGISVRVARSGDSPCPRGKDGQKS